MTRRVVSTYQQVGMGAFGRGPEFEALHTVTQAFLETPLLASFVESEQHEHFQQAELKRHLAMLREAVASAPTPEKSAV